MRYNFFFCLLCLSLTTSLAQDNHYADKINNATELSGLEEQHNTINYNTSQKDARKIENVVATLHMKIPTKPSVKQNLPKSTSTETKKNP